MLTETLLLPRPRPRGQEAGTLRGSESWAVPWGWGLPQVCKQRPPGHTLLLPWDVVRGLRVGLGSQQQPLSLPLPASLPAGLGNRPWETIRDGAVPHEESESQALADIQKAFHCPCPLRRPSFKLGLAAMVPKFPKHPAVSQKRKCLLWTEERILNMDSELIWAYFILQERKRGGWP